MDKFLFDSFWRVLLPQRPVGRARRAARPRLLLEQLEDRLTPANSLGAYALLEGPPSGTNSDIVAATGAWTASANASWLHTSASGSGNGLAVFTFDANPGGTRTGTLTIADQTLTVTQAGSNYVAAQLATPVPSPVNYPNGVAVDSSGNIYIADTGDDAIKEYGAANHQVVTLVSLGLSNPEGVAVDGAGNVYIADFSNSAIEEYNAATQQLSTLVSGLNFPSAVAVDGAGNVYIADSLSNAIEEYNPSTQQLSTLVSGLNFPQGVAVDNSGNIYVADTRDNAIKEWNASTQQVSTLVSGLSSPQGLAVDSARNLYVADSANNTVEEYNASTHQLSTLVSSGLSLPNGVAVDGAGNVVIADANNNAIKEYNALTQQVSTLLYSPLFQAEDVAVDSAGNVFIADGTYSDIQEYVAATQQVVILVSSGLTASAGVALDSQGNLYITDSVNNSIDEYNPSTQQLSTLVSSGLNAPEGIAVDSAGNVYIADSGDAAIKVYNPSTQQVSTLVSSGLKLPGAVAVDRLDDVFIADGQDSAILEYNAATQQLSPLVTGVFPCGVAVDGSGNVYFGDAGNNTNVVDEYNAATQQVSTLVGGLANQVGVAVDGSGNLYFADGGNSVVDELPRAFLPASPIHEGAGAGADALAAVLPTTQALTGVYAPWCDQSWLTVGTVANGVVNFSFNSNTGAARTAYLTVLGQQIEVDQAGGATTAPPTVTDPTATAVTNTTATLGGTVTNDGGATIIKRGILYALTSTNGNPMLGGNAVTEVDDADASTGPFTENLTGLTPGLGYSYVAFAANLVGTTYTSPVSTFTTSTLPTVTSPTATAITDTTAALGGTVISDGGSSITERGVLYALTSVNSNPTLGGTGVREVGDASASTGTFTENVTGLTLGSAYSYVAFATNSVGTTYTSPVSSFITSTLPSVTSPTATSVTSSTVTLGGTVTSAGGSSITKRGILYALTAINNNPTPGGNTVTEVDDASPTTGTFTENITGLLPGTPYSFVAFASNSAGAAYTSPVATFTTLTLPTATSPTATAITNTTATLGGNVTSNGGSRITKRGILYSLTSVNTNPMLGGNGVHEVDDASSTTGIFTDNVTALTAGSSYSFVAFASTSAGTAYTIPATTFTTLRLPTVTSSSVTAITSTTAILGGNVTSNGGSSITKRGVLCALTSVNSNPTLGGTGVSEVDDAGASTGVFTENVTGLSTGSGYSYVAFATNSVGTAYTSPASSFTPLGVPTVTSPTATSVTSSTATLGGMVTGDGGSSITKRGVLYALTSVNNNPTSGGTGVSEVDDAGASTGVFTVNVTGLSAGSGYSYVAFASNRAGTAYTSTAYINVQQATPVITVSDSNSNFNGQSFPATAIITGVNGQRGNNLEGVGLVLTYYAGTSASGSPLAGAPMFAGTYTAVASFAGSPDYTSGSSPPTTFTIAPGPSGAISSDEPTFIWRTVGGASQYDIWVSDQTTGQSPLVRVRNSMGAFELTAAQALTPGDSYLWYLAAMDSTGQDGQWSAGQPFTIAPLSAPTPNLPTGSIATAQPTFSWTAVSGAASYELWISGQTISVSGGTTTSYTIPASQALTPGQSYTWWVAAVSTNGKGVTWSTTPKSFAIAALAAPTLIGPSGTVSSDQPTFSWTAVSGAASYELWISGQTITVPGGTTTSYTIPASQALTPGQSYTWWVAAVSTNGKGVTWSTTPKSLAIAALAAPTLIGPGGTVSSDQPTFSWTAVSGAASYELWISGQTITVPGGTTTSYTIPASQALTPGQSYTWWVAAVSTNGKGVTWSTTPKSFAIAALAAPTLVGPSGTVSSDQPTFSWTAVSGAASYELWISGQTISVSGGTTTLYTIPASQALTPGQSYTWWVAAVSTNGKGVTWSTASRTFVIA